LAPLLPGLVAGQSQTIGIRTSDASSRGLRGLTANILTENVKMKKLFRSASFHVTVENWGDTCEMTMLFVEAPSTNPDGRKSSP
jgi:hypothetical protein